MRQMSRLAWRHLHWKVGFPRLVQLLQSALRHDTRCIHDCDVSWDIVEELIGQKVYCCKASIRCTFKALTDRMRQVVIIV